MSEHFEVIGMGLATAQICTTLKTADEVVERYKQYEKDELLKAGISRDCSMNWQLARLEHCANNPNPNNCDENQDRKHWLLEC